MAIQLNHTRYAKKETFSLDPAFTGVLERGMLMVDTGNTGADGQMLVAPSLGAATDRVQGILWLSETSQVSSPLVESLDIPLLAPRTVTLAQTPIAVGNIRAVNRTTGAAIAVVPGAPAAGELGLLGKVLTADVALAGVLIRVTYRYTLTSAQIAKMGRRTVNQGGEGPYGLVELLRGNLEVCLSNFVTSAAYSLGTVDVAPPVSSNLTSAADGLVTIGGAGPVFARLVNMPTMHLTPGLNQAFITIECNLPAFPTMI
jgi:hypothetical protein